MKTWTRLLFCATALTTAAAAAPALAAGLDETVTFNIAPGRLDEALIAYANQADLQVISASADVRGKQTSGLDGAATPREALAMLLEDSGLSFMPTGTSTVTVTQGEQAGGGSSADGTVEALIVTAQKREEDIQDVPIAISAFTQETLDQQKIEGGFDLLKAIPNVTFSKNNFTSYNFSIRGVGTKAISATTDPGVSVSFNNTGLIQNRLFEQEYFDIERVEVLRGPQGTLYGRNATAGVINVISAKPDLNDFDGWVKGEVGNYHTKRVSAMINVPVVEDKLAIRLAGALTDRQGYDYNSITKNAVNGRDLWSARLTVGFQPTERIRGNLIWERFNEDDDRSRTGKQLCHRDPGPSTIGATPVTGVHPEDINNHFSEVMRPALFSQGCRPGSLYDDAAFGTPNGLALPFVFSMLAFGGDCGLACPSLFNIGALNQNGRPQTVVQVEDPYRGMMQSRDLRTIASFRDPIYRAEADVLELNLDIDITDRLTLTSQTAYNQDTVYSFQDFNRFNTFPVFTDTSQLSRGTTCTGVGSNRVCVGNGVPSRWRDLAPGGIFCDPQLGCSDTLAGFDISQAKSHQFSQEVRLSSDFDGKWNFNIGANYTRFNVLVDYYVFYNLITAYALVGPFNGGQGNEGPDPTKCKSMYFSAFRSIVDGGDPRATCPYIDPNPIESLGGDGHNYFRSKNPYKLESGAAFAEAYWNIAEDIKVTAGLRYTDDRKTFIPVPSQVLLSTSIFAGGFVSRGYPELDPIEQNWGEWTGRLGVDWKPTLSFTDDTMVYAFYSHGYKGGGANPPSPGYANVEQLTQLITESIAAGDPLLDQAYLDEFLARSEPVLFLTGVEYGATFKPEFVDAFEIGAKNTLLGGALTLNATAFYYDYKDYQVSQIRDRTAVNENFDARTWGAELETVFAPSRNFQLVANIGYLDTEIGDGMKSIDIMNRTQGNPDYVLVKPWVQLPSNCVVPVGVVESWLQERPYVQEYWGMCGGWTGLIAPIPVDPNPEIAGGTQPYDYRNYPELNGGAGLHADLSGNELPNAPHWTANIGAQYGFDLLEDWRVTVRGDAYWQSQSWARVYNADPYDKLHGWYNVNLSVWFERPEDDLKIELYAKNLLDKTPITDAFLNSDDTALTTNVFVLDPRLIGLSIKKGF